jgi:hypothetical protein
MGEGLEALRVSPASGCYRVIRQPAQLRRMLVDATVDRRIRENLDVDTRTVDILKPRVIIPRDQWCFCPYADQTLRVLAEFHNVRVISFQRVKKFCRKRVTMKVYLHLTLAMSHERASWRSVGFGGRL